MGLSSALEEIEVESQVGRGTTFTISLPNGLKEKEQVIAPPMIEDGRRGMSW